MATVLSGTSGALYYKPAGTKNDQLAATAFPSSGSDITVGTYLNFKVNDQVTLAYPTNATTTGAIAAGDYFVLTYTASTGVMTLSSSEGGAAVTAILQVPAASEGAHRRKLHRAGLPRDRPGAHALFAV